MNTPQDSTKQGNSLEKQESSIEDRLGEIIGEASMCWSETPTGVFESLHASKLIDEVRTTIEKVREEEREKNLYVIRETKGDGGYVCFSPQVPYILEFGKTSEEALNNLIAHLTT